VSYAVEWLPGAAAVGAVALLCVPSLVLIGLVVVLLAVVAALVAFAGAIVATPYLLVRSLRRRQRRRSATGQHRARHRALNA
jgi:membrane protein implicated in regulation of membrane protease activity